MANDVNINKLVAKHGLQNVQIQDKPLQFLDISNIGTFHEMQNKVAEVEQGFARLPSKIRGHFKNKANNLADYMADSRNHPEAWSLGLLEDEDGLLQNAWEKLHPKKEEIKEPVKAPEKTTPVGVQVDKEGRALDKEQQNLIDEK